MNEGALYAVRVLSEAIRKHASFRVNGHTLDYRDLQLLFTLYDIPVTTVPVHYAQHENEIDAG